MNKLGIMQSRLIPRLNEKSYQWFPDKFYYEFPIAKYLGFDYIELINGNEYLDNPYPDIKLKDFHTYIPFDAICLDHLMEIKIQEHERWLDACHYSWHLEYDIKKAELLESKLVVIPFLEQTSLRDVYRKYKYIYKNLHDALRACKETKVKLCIETDLSPKKLKAFLKPMPELYVCYDTGNCADLGYDLQEAIDCYGNKIAHIHLKDKSEGQNVFIGTGKVKWLEFFETMKKIGYQGNYTLQPTRPEDNSQVINYVAEQFKRIKQYIEVVK